MTEPLSVVCDHCSAKLKLKNPDLEGKKIKCPKCGEAFVARSADAPPTAAKIAKKKTASDDDDLSFLDVDPDDYGAPPEDEDDFDGDDAPKERRSRSSGGGKKKSKKKSKKSGDPGKAALVVGIVLAVALVLGGGVFALVSLTGGSGNSDVDWLPADIQGYVKIHADDIWAANVFLALRNGPAGQKMVEEMTKEIGVGPQDIELATISIPANGKPQGGVVVIRSKKSFDSAKLQASDPAAKQMSHMGSSYIKKPDNSVLFLPDPNTLIEGPESVIQELIARGKKNPSESKFTFSRNCRDHLVMAMIDPTAANNNPMASSPLAFASGRNSESVLMRGNASSDIRVSVQGSYRNAESAKADADKVKADLEKGKADLAKSKTQMQSMPANPFIKTEQIMKLMSGAEQVMNSISVSNSGSRLNMQITVSGQLINDFAEMAAAAPGGPPVGLRRMFGTR
jgi:predicted Zn finger-like uncharacterized protein